MALGPIFAAEERDDEPDYQHYYPFRTSCYAAEGNSLAV